MDLHYKIMMIHLTMNLTLLMMVSYQHHFITKCNFNHLDLKEFE